MRGGSRHRTRLARLLIGLPVILSGCVLDTVAEERTLPSTRPLAIATSSPSPDAQPTSAPTLPPTVAEPTAVAEPSPSSTTSPTPSVASPSPTNPPPEPIPSLRYDPPPKRGPFAMNLYHRGDFATQVTKIYCVPGAMQTMINVMDRGARKASHAVQDRLYRLARRLSTDRLRGQGAEPEGWARGLQRLGYGRFEVVVAGSINGAIRAAARAMRRTNRPVGLLVWRGAHAWVMTGFRATADPAMTSRFRVTHVRIVDVWFPRVSSIWGASVPPNTLVPVSRLPEDFLPWRRPTMRYPEKDRRFVIVAPVAG